MRRRFVVLPALLLFAACNSAPATPPVDTTAEAALITARSDSLVMAENAKDADRALAYYLDDAVVQLGNAPQVQGKAAMKDLYNQFFPTMKELDGTTTKVVVSSAGDMAWEQGVNKLTMTTPGGDVVTMGKYLAIWQKNNGVWMLSAIAVSDDAPPPPPPPPAR